MLKIDAKTKRILLWLVLGFVVVIVALIIIAVTRKKSTTTKGATGSNAQPPGNTGTTLPTVPAGTPSTATPPYLPTNPTTGNSAGTGTLPTDVIEINWTYIQDLVWKMDEVTRATGSLNPGISSYKCEITNGILEMGARDLSAMVQTYRQWYGRSFRDNYCQKVTTSGCWTALWDDKPKKACEKLKSYP